MIVSATIGAAFFFLFRISNASLPGDYKYVEFGNYLSVITRKTECQKGPNGVSICSKVVVPEGVVDYVVSGDYIFALRMQIETLDCRDVKGRPVVFTRYSKNSEYWAIKWTNNLISGPLSDDKFNAFLKANSLTYPKLSIPTNYKQTLSMPGQAGVSCGE